MEPSKLAEALAKAATEFPTISFDKKNPHFGSKYASLESIISAVTPILSAHDMAITQTFDVTEHGNVIMTTTLRHSSGEILESKLPLMNDTKGRNAMQSLGSAVTYARRYALSAMLGTAAGVKSEEDDDGNQCEGMKPEHRKIERTKPVEKPVEKPKPTGVKDQIFACHTWDNLRALVMKWMEFRPILDNAESWSGILPLIQGKLTDEGWQSDSATSMLKVIHEAIDKAEQNV